MGKILLFYKYVQIEDPHAIMRWQRDLCTRLGIKGRILLAHEGINGTVGGTDQATIAYTQELLNHPLFSGIDVKSSDGAADHFPRLRIAVRNEIVAIGLGPDIAKPENTGVHLTPAQTHELIKQSPDNLILLDTRNKVESAIGTFTNAIKADIDTFRDLPSYIDANIDLFKDKQVLMFCTGGIRCERATAYLQEKNIAQKVYQIEGGIHRYTEQYPDGYFRGKNYVFDGRIAMKINDDILTNCNHCKQPCDDYTNCVNAFCNLQYICCTQCLPIHTNTCSQKCQTLVQAKNVVVRTAPAKIVIQEQHG